MDNEEAAKIMRHLMGALGINHAELTAATGLGKGSVTNAMSRKQTIPIGAWLYIRHLHREAVARGVTFSEETSNYFEKIENSLFTK